MNISRFFIDRPIFAAVLSIVVFLAGAIALTQLPVSEYPDVVPPSVVVRATYPGANPKVIAETVAAPLEQQINGVENMLYMSSQATTDGVLTLTVTFKIGTDVELAEVQVQNRVQRALPRLPEEVRQIGVMTQKSSPDLTMVVHLVSPDSRYDELYLRNYAVLNVRDELQRIPGVGEVLVLGAGDYAMRVWLDPDKLAARNLTARDVVRAIREQNVQVAAGVVGAAARRRSTPSSSSRSTRAGPPGHRGGVRRHHRRHRARRRRDCACATWRASSSAPASYALRSLLDNKPAVAIGVFQAPGRQRARSSPTRCARRWTRLKKDFPDGVDYRIVYDPTRFVRAVDRRGGGDAARGDRCWWCWWSSSSCRPGAPRSSRSPAVPVSLVGTFAVMLALRLLAQHAVALRPGARHRHRGGRRHRRGGERRAQHRARLRRRRRPPTARWAR